MDKLNPLDLGLKETVDYSEIIKNALIPQGIMIPPPEVVFEIDNIPLLTKESISLLIAKAKAGKTTVAAWIASNAILKGINVLWIDTEQGIYYGSRTQFWILSIAGIKDSENLKYFDLKAFNPNIRIDVIDQIITEGNFDFVVIDGVRDLAFSINSEEEATTVSTKLMSWAKNKNCHLMTILHQNKNDNNARGHLGAELVNKSEATLKVTKEDEKAIVEPEFCRAKDFNPFALQRDEDGIPHLLEDWEMKPNTAKEKKKEKILLPNEIDKSTHLELLKKMFENESEKKYKAFGISIQNELNTVYGYNISFAKAENYLQHYLTNKLVLLKGSTPQTKYFINPELLN
jgi:KaiC/GvpD/RAD55 family RecA-like ATPase